MAKKKDTPAKYTLSTYVRTPSNNNAYWVLSGPDGTHILLHDPKMPEAAAEMEAAGLRVTSWDFKPESYNEAHYVFASVSPNGREVLLRKANGEVDTFTRGTGYRRSETSDMTLDAFNAAKEAAYSQRAQAALEAAAEKAKEREKLERLMAQREDESKEAARLAALVAEEEEYARQKAATLKAQGAA